jgi:hypothetical protein
MVCTALNKKGQYLWEIYTSHYPGCWDNYAEAYKWEQNWKDSINEGLEVFKSEFPNAVEINYTEGNLCIAGNFDDKIEIKEEIIDLIQRYKPELLAYFN